MPLTRRLALASLGAAALPLPLWARSPAAPSASLAFDPFNAASDAPLLKMGSKGAATARAQILFDRVWFSPGEIDGAFGRNLQRMVRAYQGANGLKETGTVDEATWKALREADSAPLLTRYTITEKDAAGPFAKTPTSMAARAELKALPYASLSEALAERFHVAPAFLQQLNPGVKLAAGAEIVVPNVLDSKAPTRASQRLEIDKAEHVLFVLDGDGKPAAGFPISMGNEARDPLPVGKMAIKNAVEMPSYTYNPAILKTAPKNAAKAEIPPGPNNPVGTIWLGLTKPHWGIHGTPEPSRVGHDESNGCIHLTNWDAERLAKVVKVGAQVDVRA
ncbi:L,D-transpeptidase family protein [Ottowia flava]|uniref:L,D-transpeptidase family protein n=1 Tax=Ottowia flava TaxID=2675430 RepID=A0ABW4KYI7_9BURK|nr:L,D-transpeptidase [Ottowia sp. GY511]